MQISFVETLLQELDIAYSHMSDVLEADDPTVVSDVVERVENIVARARVSGLCKADGMELHRMNALGKDVVDKMTEYRSQMMLDTIGLQVDSASLRAGLLGAAIAALAALLGFIVYKIVGFFRSLFSGGASAGGGAKAAASASGKKVAAKMKDTGNPEGKEISEFVTAQFLEFASKSSIDVFGDAWHKFQFLTYPKDCLGQDWVNTIIKHVAGTATSLGDWTIQGDIDVPAIEKLVDNTLNLPRKELIPLVSAATFYLEKVFETPPVPKENERFNDQLKEMSRWTAKAQWMPREYEDIAKMPVSAVSVFNEKEVDTLQKLGEDAMEKLNKLQGNIAKVKVNDRRASQMVNTYYRQAVEKPIKFMQVVMQRLVLKYLTALAKFVGRTDRIFGDLSRDIIQMTGFIGQGDATKVTLEQIKNMGVEFVKAYNAADKIPDWARRYQGHIKDRPKSFDDVLTMAVAVGMEGQTK